MSNTLEPIVREVIKTSSKCEPFRVEPKNINWKLFEEERKDPQQEIVRQLIKVAQRNLEVDPERYGRRFETHYEYFGTVKDYSDAVESALIEKGKFKFLGEISEQAFEIAQKISNGKSWESLCNLPDSYEYTRLIRGDSYVGRRLFMHSSKTYYLFGGKELGAPANYKIIEPDKKREEYIYKSGPGGGDVGPIGERYVTVRGDKIEAKIALLLVNHLDTYKSPLRKKLDEEVSYMETYSW